MYNFTEKEWDLISQIGFIEPGNSKYIAAEGIYYGGEKIVFDKLQYNQKATFW